MTRRRGRQMGCGPRQVLQDFLGAAEPPPISDLLVHLLRWVPLERLWREPETGVLLLLLLVHLDAWGPLPLSAEAQGTERVTFTPAGLRGLLRAFPPRPADRRLVRLMDAESHERFLRALQECGRRLGLPGPAGVGDLIQGVLLHTPFGACWGGAACALLVLRMLAWTRPDGSTECTLEAEAAYRQGLKHLEE